MKLSYLANYPEHVSTVAKWIFDEWGHQSPDTTLESLETRFKSHLHRTEIPLSFLAMDEDRPLGTASLVFQDMKDHLEHSPWLSAVYVLPEFRGQGIGSKLVKTVELISAHLDIEQLYLFTPDHEAFYTNMNWTVLEKTSYDEKDVVIMTKEI